MSLTYRYKDQLVLGEVSNITLLTNVTSALIISFLTVEERQPRVVSLSNNITIPIGQSTTEIPFTALNAGNAIYQIVSSPQIYQPMGDYLRFSVVQYAFLRWISAALGWSYFACWGIAIYPQIFQNFLRKSTEGYSCDRLLLNIVGYIPYAVFKISLYSSPFIQQQYFSLHPGGVNPVRLNDVMFPIQSTILTLIILCQILIYSKGFRVSFTACIMTFLLCFSCLIAIFLATISVITWLNCLYVMSYVKFCVSLIKFIPQAWINYKTKSTVGFNIIGIWLDILGGILSILQMLTLAFNFKDWTSIIGNFAKFLLGFVSIAYNLFFIIQHYVLYGPKSGSIECFGKAIYSKKMNPESQRLLVGSDS